MGLWKSKMIRRYTLYGRRKFNPAGSFEEIEELVHDVSFNRMLNSNRTSNVKSGLEEFLK